MNREELLNQLLVMTFNEIMDAENRALITGAFKEIHLIWCKYSIIFYSLQRRRSHPIITASTTLAARPPKVAASAPARVQRVFVTFAVRK